MSNVKKNEKTPKSLRFYLCLMLVLAGVYLALVAVLAIRNPKTETPEVLPVSSAESSYVPEAETKEEEEEVNHPSGDRVGTQPAKEAKPDPKSSALEDYGRGKERYTVLGAQDVFSKVNVTITNEEELESIVGVGADTVKSYLNTYASHNNIEAAACTVLDHVYVGFLSERVEIYMQFDDEEGSLVTVLFEPANASHASHVDVLPCQYSLKEIQEQAWL